MMAMYGGPAHKSSRRATITKISKTLTDIFCVQKNYVFHGYFLSKTWDVVIRLSACKRGNNGKIVDFTK